MLELIGTEIKKQLKQQRLEQYKKRYFELELDRVALLANGDELGAQEIVVRMNVIEDAYNAVKLVPEE
jgi:protein involved in sex pheromone biosynthesis